MDGNGENHLKTDKNSLFCSWIYNQSNISLAVPNKTSVCILMLATFQQLLHEYEPIVCHISNVQNVLLCVKVV